MTLKNNNITTVVASIALTIIGVLGSIFLKQYSIIGEASLVTLIIFSVIVGLLLHFSPFLKEFNLKLTGLSLKMRDLDVLKAKETEPNVMTEEHTALETPESTTNPFSIEMKGHSFAPDECLVYYALGTSDFAWRGLGNIVHATDLSVDTVLKVLKKLEEYGLVVKSQADNYDGFHWGLSPNGRKTLPAIIAWKEKRHANNQAQNR